MTETRPTKRIGDVNGWMAALFRAQLVIVPVLMTFMIGLEVHQMRLLGQHNNSIGIINEKLSSFGGNVYTRDSARADSLELRREIMKEVSEKFPPPFLLRQVEALERRVIAIEERATP